MLDIKFIRENADLVRQSLAARAAKVDLDELLALDEQRRKILLQLDDLRRQKNEANDEIAKLLKEKKDPKAKIASMKQVALKVDDHEAELKEKEEQLSKMVMIIPNVVDKSIPVGDPSHNKIVRKWGEIKKFSFKPQIGRASCRERVSSPV